MQIQRVLVVGAGQMGSGIAQVLAHGGLQVLLHDVDDERITKGIADIDNRLLREVQKGRITEEQQHEILGRIEPIVQLTDARDIQLVIEAATENMEIKCGIFRKLDSILPADVILATNTSSLPITELAAVTGRAERVIGMHFMNPVPVMKLIEVIRGLATSDETYEAVEALAQQIDKTPVEVNDFPGFISNRILMPMINEAVFCVYEGIAKPAAIDQVMMLGMNHPMGPLQLADFIGLDTCLAIMEILHDGLGDDKYRPCPLLRKYVKAGWLGKKSGKGFYSYDG
ncbi:3-hydroxybutyryl-CoA dehydrogenase [Paenibacillus albiflavus]|uniref:3-hydroxybutyryl-CoA dehydrogenase n=1 Tax=Paenibacillus albiflavus TaxID=2545760 RepID=A0A4R4EIZ1_9BACL|nr:3-hydroxybutyryl-CoA dehydrogenase [Paenibacillus albiflavus]TCZ80136.1 3-hydroxybutyryl-CoA dehydrogenase [Paenibacillus albiflavus]